MIFFAARGTSVNQSTSVSAGRGRREHCELLLGHWLLVHWLLVHWLLVHWLLVHWLLAHWLLVHWLLVHWLIKYRVQTYESDFGRKWTSSR